MASTNVRKAIPFPLFTSTTSSLEQAANDADTIAKLKIMLLFIKQFLMVKKKSSFYIYMEISISSVFHSSTFGLKPLSSSMGLGRGSPSSTMCTFIGSGASCIFAVTS